MADAASARGWVPIDDWTNGQWKRADADVKLDGRRLTCTMKPTGKGEFPIGVSFAYRGFKQKAAGEPVEAAGAQALNLPELRVLDGLAVVVRAFDVRERFFHFEYFRTSDNRIIGLEVNIRPPGGLTTDMMNFANDIDIYSAWAHVVTNNKVEILTNRPYHCGYIGRKHNKNYQLSHAQIIERFGSSLMFHGDISGIFSIALGNYGYLVRSPNLEEIISMAEEIQKKHRSK